MNESLGRAVWIFELQNGKSREAQKNSSRSLLPHDFHQLRGFNITNSIPGWCTAEETETESIRCAISFKDAVPSKWICNCRHRCKSPDCFTIRTRESCRVFTSPPDRSPMRERKQAPVTKDKSNGDVGDFASPTLACTS